MSATPARADHRETGITDNLILSNEGGRWSVHLDGGTAAPDRRTPDRPVWVPERSAAR